MPRTRIPFWLTIMGMAVVVLCHTQLTVRQLALRVTGVREGEVGKLVSLEDYFVREDRFDRRRLHMPSDFDPNDIAILLDVHAGYIPGELVGKALHFDWGRLTVLDNTARHVLVSCDSVFEVDASLKKSNNYRTGPIDGGALGKAAVGMPRINVTPGDLALLLFVLAMVLWWYRSKESIHPPPSLWGIVILLVIGAASLVPAMRPFDSSLFAPNVKRGVMEVVQMAEIFLLAWLSFATAFRSKDSRHFFFQLICVMTGIVCVLGLAEYWAVFSGRTLRGLLDVEALDGPFGIRFNAPRAWSAGSESNRNVLALYLAMTFPFLIAATRAGSSIVRRIVAGVCATAGVVLILHAALLVVAFIGGLWVVLAGKARWVAAYASLFVIAVGAVCCLNPDHGKVLLDSVAIRRAKDPYGLQPMPSKGGIFDGDQAWQQKFAERQAAMNALGYSPVLGIGIGNYQAAINDFYSNAKVDGHDLEKSPVNLMERNSHPALQVVAVETGVLGVVALIVLMLTFVTRSMSTENAAEDADDKTLQRAVTGSCLVLTISLFQTSFLIRGIGIVAAAILSVTGKTVDHAVPVTPSTSPTAVDDEVCAEGEKKAPATP